MANDRYGLEAITERFDFLLFDTSSLQIKTPNAHLKSGADIMDDVYFLRSLNKCLNSNYPFYITQMVYDEALSGVKKYWETNPSPSDITNHLSEDSLVFMLHLYERTLRAFKQTEHVIEWEEEGLSARNEFAERYARLRGDMSDVDFDFLISGLVIATYEGSCALLTNDFAIVNGLKDLRFLDRFLLRTQFTVYHSLNGPPFQEIRR